MNRLWGLMPVALLLILAAPVLAQDAAAADPAPADAVAVEKTPAELGVQVSGGSKAVEAASFFYVFAITVLGCSLAICISQNIVRMAVYLFGTLASVAVLYFLLLANFIGVIQLIVYAGGTLILLIFGVMLTSKSPWARFDVKRSELVLAAVVCLVFAAALLHVVVNAEWPQAEGAVEGSRVATFGESLLTTYLVPFEAISVLLLVVMIGAALMARQERVED